jgi:predicted nucleic acid-binding protein
MAYKISHLNNVAIQNRPYFLDANIWIKILRPKLIPSDRDKKYLAFYKKLITSAAKPKIAVTSMVFSEVINRVMRDVAMSKYMREEAVNPAAIDKSFYKSVYRKSPHFQKQYNLLCQEILELDPYYHLMSDSLGNDIKLDDLFSDPDQGLDFNDNYYVQLAKKVKFPIVTDDSDFFVEEVEILTYNDKLYQRSKNLVKPMLQVKKSSSIGKEQDPGLAEAAE